MKRMTAQEHARFLAKTVQSGSCLLWIGPLDGDGYGTFWLRRKNRRAHRVAYWNRVGDIPKGLVIDHVCGKRACVNVAHLRLITARENALSGRSITAINSQKTHCPQGHPYDRHYGKQRYCSLCARAKTTRLRKKWAAEDTVQC